MRVKIQGSRFKVQGSRFKVQGSRFMSRMDGPLHHIPVNAALVHPCTAYTAGARLQGMDCSYNPFAFPPSMEVRCRCIDKVGNSLSIVQERCKIQGSRFKGNYSSLPTRCIHRKGYLVACSSWARLPRPGRVRLYHNDVWRRCRPGYYPAAWRLVCADTSTFRILQAMPELCATTVAMSENRGRDDRSHRVWGVLKC